LMAVKLVNLAVAAVVVARLLRTWIPALFVQRQMQRVKFEGVSQVARDIEQSFHAAFQTTPDAMCIVRFDDGVIVAVNEGYTRMSGWSESEAVGRTSVDLGLWIDVEQRITLLFDPAVLDNEIELAHERGKRSRFRDLRVLPLQWLPDPLVRVRAEDVVDAARVRLIRQVQLLRKAHVRQHEHERAPVALAKRPDVCREILAGMREPDAFGIRRRLARRRQRIVVADEADLDRTSADGSFHRGGGAERGERRRAGEHLQKIPASFHEGTIWEKAAEEP